MHQLPFRRIAISSGRWAPHFADPVKLTDPAVQQHNLRLVADDIARAYLRGADAIMLREKRLAPSSLLALIQAVRETTNTLGIKLLVNDPDLLQLYTVSRQSTGASLPFQTLIDGLHQKDIEAFTTIAPRSKLWLGRSCHTTEHVQQAAAAGYHYAFLSPIFDTATHPMAMPLGIKALEKACAVAEIPVFALGGITAANEHICLNAGAYGIAAIGMFGL